MPTRIFAQNKPLTDAEFDRLGEFLRWQRSRGTSFFNLTESTDRVSSRLRELPRSWLSSNRVCASWRAAAMEVRKLSESADAAAGCSKGCKGGNAMNIEELDGFFAALVAGPDMVMPSEYLPEVFGGEMSETCKFDSLDGANEILALMMRHWNAISATLHKDEVYPMMLLEDEDGVAHGNDWARGFMRGVGMSPEGWAEFLADKEQGGWMLPALALYHEHDEDPEMRPEPISPERREDIIVHMAGGLLAAYRYFRQQRQAYAATDAPEPERTAPKVGRNDPCPCGSGKKYKRCCLGVVIH